ncbi:MAG: hypothetical protein HOC66_05630 [Flavobacteriales bacterium]|nr:hypothetical protein [Flavobacteriales bacterium]|tara:strand:- start:293 stop:475 length:183 start_codon:yes stop_codon:yes gene_type:complete
MKKQYLFWREVRKTVREELVVEADNLEEATRKHNEDGIADYEETEEIFSEINDEGTEEIK